MYKPVPPCKGCDHRTAENPELGTHDCHGSCEVYQAYREDQFAYNKMIQNEKVKNCRLTDIQWSVYRKHHKQTMG